MQKYLMVEADTNDADYVRSLKPIDDKTLEKFLPLFEAIKAFKPYKAEYGSEGRSWTHQNNFPASEYRREDLGEKSVEEVYAEHKEALLYFMDTHVPLGEHGIHTITKIEVYVVSEVNKLI